MFDLDSFVFGVLLCSVMFLWIMPLNLEMAVKRLTGLEYKANWGWWYVGLTCFFMLYCIFLALWGKGLADFRSASNGFLWSIIVPFISTAWLTMHLMSVELILKNISFRELPKIYFCGIPLKQVSVEELRKTASAECNFQMGVLVVYLLSVIYIGGGMLRLSL